MVFIPISPYFIDRCSGSHSLSVRLAIEHPFRPTLRVLREWHEVSRRPFTYRQFERFVSGVAFWPFDRNKSNLTLSHASPSLPVTTPTMLRGTQSIDAAVYESLTSCHSAKSHYTSTSVDMIRGHSTSRLLELLYG